MRRLTRTLAAPEAIPPAAAFLLLVLRQALPERSLTDTGPRAIWDAVFALLLAALIGLLATSTGARILRPLNLRLGSSRLEASLFAFATGAGLLGVVVFVVGLIGVLDAAPLAVLLIGMLWVNRASAWTVLRQVASRETYRTLWGRRSPLERFGVAMTLLILGLSVLQALAPAWDYDGLMYHLQAPRLFLEAHRILPLPQIWQANGPLTVETLYTLGLAFGSDSSARLVHLGFTLALILTGVAMGRRFVGGPAGWMAGAFLVGIPILPIWGSLAFADAGWALFEVLAVFALVRWLEARTDPGWLVLAGGMAGLALGSKYLAVGLLVPVGLTVIVAHRKDGARATLRSLALMFGAAGLVASPWYLKNLIWFHNPVYPFGWGGPEWSPERLRYLMAYLGSFGTGRAIADFVALPWNLYVRHEAFGTFMTTIEVPGLIFPVALLAPWARLPAAVRSLAWITLARFGFWAAGSQQIRFLLPMFPLLAVVAASVCLQLGRRWLSGPAARLAGAGISLGLVAATAVYQLVFMAGTAPLPVVSGREAKDSFLARAVYDYPAMRYIRTELPPQARVYMAWDGQGYYCDARCLPDAEQSQWAQLAAGAVTPAAISARLRSLGFTHLLVDIEGMNFLLRHDPTDAHAAGVLSLAEFTSACLEPAFESPKVVVFSMVCG